MNCIDDPSQEGMEMSWYKEYPYQGEGRRGEMEKNAFPARTTGSLELLYLSGVPNAAAG